jgi:hypothetical protein
VTEGSSITVRVLSLAFIAFWLLLGLYFMLQGVELGLGSISNPGTGFMPFLVAIVMIGFGILSTIPLLTPAANSGSDPVPLQRLRDPAIVVVSMILYSLALERIGFIASTGALILFLARFVGRTTVLGAAAVSVLATLFCYGVFGLLLGVRLP